MFVHKYTVSTEKNTLIDDIDLLKVGEVNVVGSGIAHKVNLVRTSDF